MDIKRVAEGFSVSGQITAADLQELRALGVKTLVCNRPDNEAQDQPLFTEFAAQARELGMTAIYLPVVHDTINSNDAAAFAALLAGAERPVHAWCRSGLRSIALWCLASIKDGADSAALVEKATALGFDFLTFHSRFAPVIAELTDVFSALPVAQHCPVLIVGGGAGGIALAASLLRRDGSLQITIVEPADAHYYQPGFTLVGAGVFTASQTVRSMASLMPKKVQWLKAAVSNFLPGSSQVVLDNGTRLGYDRLCVCAGLKLDWGAVEGLPETLGKNGVTSNYRYDLAPYTWQLVQQLNNGKALFTQPSMPIKCAGAPQKALYLSADHWLRTNRLSSIDVHFYNAGAVLFGVKEYVPALQKYIDRYHAKLHFGQNLVKVDGPNRLATFASTDAAGNPVKQEVSFDMLHVCPPQCAPDFIRNSPLADRAGWVDVDSANLRHRKYPNVWGLGDVTNTPNAKTAAAVRKQVPVVAINMLHDLRNEPALASYEGYGSCPLLVERGRVVLAEFGYGGKLQPSFPTWLNDGTKPTRLGWILKKDLLPFIYFKLMLKGRETLAGPTTKP
jgi:sulfide:quinone oxidoreductase